MNLRTIFVYVLLLLLAAAGIATLVASAQSDIAASNDPTQGITSGALADKASSNAAAFVIYLSGNGEATCRVATPAERTRIMERRGDSQLIYAGAPRAGEKQVNTRALAREQALGLQASAGLKIVLHGTTQLNQNQAAKDAFIVAANRWEALISTPVTVVLDVDFGTTFFGDPYPSGVLGATGTSQATRPYAEVRDRLLANSPTTPETQLYNALPGAAGVPTQLSNSAFKSLTVKLSRANERALGFVPDIGDPNAVPLGGGDAGIGFNSAFAFDFDPSNGVDSNKTDFDSVATHELGHALGFLSESGGPVYAPVAILDLFRFRPNAASIGTLATALRIMSSGGSQVYFNGQTNTFGTQELGLSTGGPNGDVGDGSQSSHWKADELTFQYIGIMDPTIARGERDPITDNDVKALDSFGYSIGSPVPGPPPPPPAPPLPANDNFASATVIQGVAGGTLGNSTGATKEAGEPVMLPTPDAGAGGRSIWYRWTSPVNGNATFDTEGSGYDTILAVSTGNSLGSLSRLAVNDDIVGGEFTNSRVMIAVTAGTTYQIAVDGFDNSGSGPETGLVELNWSATGTAPPTPSPTPTPTPTPAPTPAIVSGRVIENVTPLPGVLVGLAQNSVVLQQLTTGADGRWSFNGAFVGQSYEVLFVKSGYSFSPPSLIFPVNQTPQNMGDVFATKGNPIDASDFFVTKHYDDFLGRTADSAGLSFWTGGIESCVFNLQCREVRRIDTSAAFFLSIEFQETGYLVYRVYKAAYGDAFDPTIATPGSPQGYPVPVIRRPEFLGDMPLISQGVQVGVGNWQEQLEANKQAFMLTFVGRARFTTAYPSTMTGDEFVTKLDQRAGGVLSAAEKSALVALLGATPSDSAKRAQVLRSVAEDADLNARETNRAFVLMQYFGYLRRDPNVTPDTNYTGYKFWLDKLNSFNGNFRGAEMVKAFIGSTEYRNRFGP